MVNNTSEMANIVSRLTKAGYRQSHDTIEMNDVGKKYHILVLINQSTSLPDIELKIKSYETYKYCKYALWEWPSHLGVEYLPKPLIMELE